LGGYRLVAIDLDDTLLDNQLQIRERVKAAILRARRQGVVVTLATGRMFRSALPYARQLGLDLPLITYQGALVKNSESGEVLYSRPVPAELAGSVLAAIRPNGYHLQVYYQDQLCMERLTPEGEHYSRMAGVAVTLVPELERFCPEPTKILVINWREELLDQLAEQLRRELGERVHITKSKPYYLEVLHPEATKGRALQVLAEHFGVPREEVMAIGDSFNDIEMLEYAGLGVAMGNARPEVKSRADYVAPDNEADGVAAVLEELVLQDDRDG